MIIFTIFCPRCGITIKVAYNSGEPLPSKSYSCSKCHGSLTYEVSSEGRITIEFRPKYKDDIQEVPEDDE